MLTSPSYNGVVASQHPSRLRIWLYGTKSYARFGSGPISPDWLWRSRRFFDWVRRGLIVAARDQDGDPVVSRETSNEVAASLGCHWFGLCLVSRGSRTRVYALVPRERTHEVREALGLSEPEPAARV